MMTMNEPDVEDQRPKCGLTDDDGTQRRHEQVLTTMVRRKYCGVPAFESQHPVARRRWANQSASMAEIIVTPALIMRSVTARAS